MYKMISPSAPPPKRKQIRLPEILAAIGLILAFGFAVFNILANLEAAGATPGFGFLFQEAGFDISESLIPYSSSDTYLQVIFAGVLNTILLAVVCIFCSTLIGIGFGLLSVGPSPVGRGLALAYVDVFRNLPKLLILLVLYAVAVNGLPHVREAYTIGHFHLSNRAVNFPTLVWTPGLWVLLASTAAGVGGALYLRQKASRLPTRYRRAVPFGFWAIALLFPLLCLAVFDIRPALSFPEMKGFDFQGGGRVSLQFVIVAATLSIYHGAQIAEVVRGGLQAVPSGQGEAAKALGLNRWLTVRLVILPQVFRIVIPPMNNQYVNLIKNTSIAIAVGYSDLMSVSGTIINQSFKPLEMMLITMAIYLVICLSVTSSLNQWHQHLTSRESR
ncbi:ABC transporter permease subunit [Labrenzia sp. CE80]|uniref:amino acid ABC transporter permease n=1 Tax=Labrenzia sp. CE80 TaxID=1788986 RepID=UPI001389BEB1|nr:ABC transporter permease subunit [Labrenzia sp. CE80]